MNALQEIGLVFVEVLCFMKCVRVLVLRHAGVVASCHFLRTDLQGVANKKVEFNFSVAEDVWVGCPSVLIFDKKLLKNTLPIFGGKVGW